MTHSREQDIEALRAFNRTYTARIGLLKSRLNGSPFTLSEARVLYELAHRIDPTAAEVARTLGLDRAQISRTLKRFVQRGLVETRGDPQHGRNQLLALTDAGRATFSALENNTRAGIGALLDGLAPTRRESLLAAARKITQLFETEQPPTAALRAPGPGDLGWVIHRQAILYAQEYGWNSDYEALAAGILSRFQATFNADREAAWIAELEGQIVGAVFLVDSGQPGVAKLRLLYVEPAARGHGVGGMLVKACIERARTLKYERLELWTNSVLIDARRLYQRAGFVLVDEAPHRSFGHDLFGQTWSLDLSRPADA